LASTQLKSVLMLNVAFVRGWSAAPSRHFRDCLQQCVFEHRQRRNHPAVSRSDFAALNTLGACFGRMPKLNTAHADIELREELNDPLLWQRYIAVEGWQVLDH
jgi:hypothetical protein